MSNKTITNRILEPLNIILKAEQEAADTREALLDEKEKIIHVFMEGITHLTNKSNEYEALITEYSDIVDVLFAKLISKGVEQTEIQELFTVGYPRLRSHNITMSAGKRKNSDR